MERLIRGIVQFRREKLPELRPRLRELAERQTPNTLFVTCADSRVVPNLVVSSEPGDLFVVRSVGNLVAPAGSDGRSSGDLSEVAALEYAVLVLGVQAIVICGHSRCGAMRAYVDGLDKLAGTPHVAEWLANARPASEVLVERPSLAEGMAHADRLSQANVLAQLGHTRTYDFVRERVAEGSLTLHGWWYDIATGDVHVWEPAFEQFVLLDEEEAERAIAAMGEAHR